MVQPLWKIVPTKPNIVLLHYPKSVLLCIYPTEAKPYVNRKTYTQMSTATLVMTAPKLEATKMPFIDEWRNQLQYTQTTSFSDKKREAIKP